ncbi:MAG: hypothetical protein GY913_14840 [Proteobacteria bacterium]|nr:hypothetical protein [Pseudomonadota bacterium]
MRRLLPPLIHDGFRAGALLLQRGEIAAAAETLERTQELAEALGHRMLLVHIGLAQGNLEVSRGNPERALELYQAAHGEAQRQGATHSLGPLCAGLGRVASEQARHADAAREYADAVEHAITTRHVLLEGHARGRLALALAELGDITAADRELQEARRLCTIAGSPVELLVNLVLEAHTRLLAGDVAAARTLRARIAVELTRLPMLPREIATRLPRVDALFP